MSNWPQGFLVTNKIGPLLTEKKLTPDMLLNQKISVQEQKSIDVKFTDIFQFYVPELKSSKDVYRWTHSRPTYMRFWHCQINFAIYCATTACGLSQQNHLMNSKLPKLVTSVLLFHVYFTTRLILSELQCPLPGHEDFEPSNNYINMSKLFKLSKEYNVGNIDFRVNHGVMGVI